jgi:hypothetical protein
MRRLVIRVSLKGFDKIEAQDGTIFQPFRSFEIVNFLRRDQEQFAFVCTLQLKDPTFRMDDAIYFSGMDAQILDQDPEKGIYTLFAKGKTASMPRVDIGLGEAIDLYLTKLEMQDENFIMTFLGEAEAVKHFLEHYKRLGIRYKIVSLGDASFSPDSLLNALTEKQRVVLSTAYKLGYYDLPRRINSDQLARKLGLVNSTFVTHRRKAERRLLAKLFEKK